MVDPKMLELSVYDGIPHLLTPVVTDPKKAVVALKWAVREMEDRYKKMSKVGVRNIDGFNARVVQAKANGETIKLQVTTGFDRETGKPTIEDVPLDLVTLPYIVVIVDEMADLMMVAGKDIEGAIQRLAQMARAAGIHLIMATQRPSVDVITGTIKANFPTRISFQVTSKIDSRTILGEQGAEQLLGQGDMLHMQGGGRIYRVHGPFVSDDEVERVVAHLKTQGQPDYLDSVTDDPEGEIAEDGDGRRRRCRRVRQDRHGRIRRRGRRLALRAGGQGGAARQEELGVLRPAPSAGRLQQGRLADRAHGEGRHPRTGQPHRQARDPRPQPRPRHHGPARRRGLIRTARRVRLDRLDRIRSPPLRTSARRTGSADARRRRAWDVGPLARHMAGWRTHARHTQAHPAPLCVLALRRKGAIGARSQKAALGVGRGVADAAAAAA